MATKRGKGRNPILSLEWGPSRSPGSKARSALGRNPGYYGFVQFESDILLYEMKVGSQKNLKKFVEKVQDSDNKNEITQDEWRLFILKFNSMEKERNKKHKEFFLNPKNNKAKNEFNRIEKELKNEEKERTDENEIYASCWSLS